MKRNGIFAVGIGLGILVLVGCAVGPTPETHQASVMIAPTPARSGALTSVAVTVRQSADSGRIAAVQGSLAYDPSLLSVEQLLGSNAFIVTAIEVDQNAGRVSFALIRASQEGIEDGEVARIIAKVSGAPGQLAQLRWIKDGVPPIVLASADNKRLTEVLLIDGHVDIR